MKTILLNILFVSTITYVQAQTPHSIITTTSEKIIIPEGITVNPADGQIYVSSIGLNKIIAIDQHGATHDFIKSGKDGLLEGLGMKIDSKRQWLWVVSNQKRNNWYTSHLHAFDLKTNKVQQQYTIRDTVPHLLNDLILHPNGKIYITDTFASSVYEADPIKKKLDLFIQDSSLIRANGIAYNPQGKIFIATRNGLVLMDYTSKKISLLKHADATQTVWMDGLVYWDNSIIGVADNAIVHYHLNSENNEIISDTTIDKANKLFHDPTTAAASADQLYVIANSYLSAYNENKESVKDIENKLGPVVILVYKLKH